MNFYDWMIHKGLRKSSAGKYEGALNGTLSKWAMDNGLISGPLTDLTSSLVFSDLAQRIQELPIFQESNARGNHMYSVALSHFAAYLENNCNDDVQFDLEQILGEPTTTVTEKTALIRSRIGQGVFREQVLLHWTCCAVTGIRDTGLLVAPHSSHGKNLPTVSV